MSPPLGWPSFCFSICKTGWQHDYKFPLINTVSWSFLSPHTQPEASRRTPDLKDHLISYYFHDFSKITIAQTRAGFHLLPVSLVHRPRCVRYSSSIKMAPQHCPVLYFCKDDTRSLSWERCCRLAISGSAHVLLPPRPAFPTEEASWRIFSGQIYCLSRFRDYLFDSLAVFLIPATHKSGPLGFRGAQSAVVRPAPGRTAGLIDKHQIADCLLRLLFPQMLVNVRGFMGFSSPINCYLKRLFLMEHHNDTPSMFY